jgi:hypothetical protein
VQLEIAKTKTVISRGEKKEEIISRNSLPHHKRASTFINTHKAARLHLSYMLSRYYPISEIVQRDGRRDWKKENPEFGRREKMKK